MKTLSGWTLLSALIYGLITMAVTPIVFVIIAILGFGQPMTKEFFLSVCFGASIITGLVSVPIFHYRELASSNVTVGENQK